MALRALALLSGPLAASSNRIGWTLALARCAAICAPMTPAPSTAALRMRMRCGSLRSTAARRACASRRPISMVLSVMSCLLGVVRDGARLPPLVHRDIGQLRFGHLHHVLGALPPAL